MDTLCNLSFGEAYGGEVAGNNFFFFFNGLVGGVAAGATCLVDTDLVLFGSVEAVVTMPLEVLPFLLLDPLGLVQTSLVGVCCGGAVIATIMSSSGLAFVGVRVTLVAPTSSSASTCSVHLQRHEGLLFFPCPFSKGLE